MTKVIGRKGMHVFDITKNGIVKINDYYFEYDPERIE